MLMFYLIVTKWLILREQKVNEILCSDWLPSRQDGPAAFHTRVSLLWSYRKKSLLGHVITLHVGREKLGISHGN